MSDYNKTLIDDLRAHGGHASSGHWVGRQAADPDDDRREDRASPERRRSPIRATAIASSSSPRRAAPRPTRPGTTTSSRTRRSRSRSTASASRRPRRIPDETERRRLYDQHAALHPSFREYEARTERVIPVIVLQTQGGVGRRLTLGSVDGGRSIPGPAGDGRRAGRRRRHACRQPGGLGRGRRTIRGLVRRSRRADPVRRDQPVRCRDRADRRPPRSLPAGDPSPVRGRPRHPVALEPRRRRGRRHRLQPAHARPRRATRPPRPARPPAGSCPTSSTTPAELDGTADLVYTGRGSLIWLGDLDAWAAVIARLLSPTGRFVLFEGHPVEWLFDADADGHWVATDYDYFGGAEASRGWAPEYIDRLSIADVDQSLEVRPCLDAG